MSAEIKRADRALGIVHRYSVQVSFAVSTFKVTRGGTESCAKLRNADG